MSDCSLENQWAYWAHTAVGESLLSGSSPKATLKSLYPVTGLGFTGPQNG